MSVRIKFLLLLTLFCFLFSSTWSSEIKKTGIPFIQHYSKKDYRGGTQNWTFVQGENHILFVGNNEGILKYDGSSWDLIPLPNQSVVRVLFEDEDGTIYAGGFNEFGFLKADESGELVYQSLNEKIPGKEPREFWRIARSGDFMYFQTYNALITRNTRTDEWTYQEAEEQFGFIHEIDGKLLLNDFGKGLAEIKGQKLVYFEGGEYFAQSEIWKIFKQGEKLLVCTQNEGIFELLDGQVLPWNTEVNQFMLNNRLFCAQESKDYIFWGSILGGLLVSDHQGHIIQHLNKNTGLNNNTILSIFLDYESNLWLGLDNGIDLVSVYSPLTNLNTGGDIGSGYAVAHFQNRIYLATNQGLYWIHDFREDHSSEEINRVHAIPELAGQVWSLHVSGEYLLVGHNRGTFALKGDLVEQIGDSPGGWNFTPIPNHPGLILQGTYNGLQVLQLLPEGPRLLHALKGFNESGKMLFFEDEQTLWIGHGYKGIFRLKLNSQYNEVDEVKLFADSSALGSKNFNELLAVEPQVLVCNENGFFTFDHAADDFVQAGLWNKHFEANGRMTRLIQEDQETYWFFQNKLAGKLRIFNDTIFVKDNRILAALSEAFSPSFENIYFLTERDLIFGTNDGFVHLDPRLNLPQVANYPVLFKTIQSLRSDSAFRVHLQYNDNLGLDSETHPLRDIPYRDNDLRVTFVAPHFTAPERLQYQNLLEGHSLEWSQWSDQNFTEFTNLREGDYLLRVKARNIFGALSDEHQLFFHVKTPWYRSVFAYVSYVLILSLIIYLTWYFINKHLEREKRRAKIIEKRKMLHKQLDLKRDSELAEKEIVKLRNEKLRADIRHKSKQLANQTMDVLQKNRFLTEIKEEMIELKKHAQADEVKSFMRRMIRKIDKNIEDEDTQKVFETNFDQVHENFLRRLQEAYPELTANDLRLCAYLRLNLSSKEIAPLLNISIRGVEISRYRLRKKLNLDHKQHLVEFILGF